MGECGKAGTKEIMMAKSFTLLREKMSPESRSRTEAKTAAIMQSLPLQELRAARFQDGEVEVRQFGDIDEEPS